MLLEGKNAVIYGAGSSIGGAVAKAFATAGAKVFVTHKRYEIALQTVNAIIAGGGIAEAAEVDALDKVAVERHLNALLTKCDGLDISFNAINIQATQSIPLTEMSVEDFIRPVNIAMQTQFITGTAAARVMKKNGKGVILSLTATPAGIGYTLVGGFGPACCAIESFSRDMAAELGIYGVRVINIRSAGSPDSRPFLDTKNKMGVDFQEFVNKITDDTMLKRLPLMNDIANTAVFLSSSMAASITGVTIDVSAGTTSALNYTMTKGF